MAFAYFLISNIIIDAILVLWRWTNFNYLSQVRVQVHNMYAYKQYYKDERRGTKDKDKDTSMEGNQRSRQRRVSMDMGGVTMIFTMNMFPTIAK